jgi:hypothetical protein
MAERINGTKKMKVKEIRKFRNKEGGSIEEEE